MVNKIIQVLNSHLNIFIYKRRRMIIAKTTIIVAKIN